MYNMYTYKHSSNYNYNYWITTSMIWDEKGDNGEDADVGGERVCSDDEGGR